MYHHKISTEREEVFRRILRSLFEYAVVPHVGIHAGGGRVENPAFTTSLASLQPAFAALHLLDPLLCCVAVEMTSPCCSRSVTPWRIG